MLLLHLRYDRWPRLYSGRGGSLRLLGVSLPSCCCFNPARVNRRFSQPATSHAAFAQRTRARPPGRRISRPNLHSLSLRPDDSLTILKDGFVSRFQRFDFSPPCYSSYEVSDCYLGGTHLPLNTSVFQLDTHSFFPVSGRCCALGMSTVAVRQLANHYTGH